MAFPDATISDVTDPAFLGPIAGQLRIGDMIRITAPSFECLLKVEDIGEGAVITSTASVIHRDVVERRLHVHRRRSDIPQQFIARWRVGGFGEEVQDFAPNQNCLEKIGEANAREVERIGPVFDVTLHTRGTSST